MIVQALQVLQGEDGYLRKDQLRELSRVSGVPLYRLHEVASFFPHFRIEQEGAEVEVHVCHDMACHLAGSNALRERLLKVFEAHGDRVRVRPVSCLGRCDRAPAALVSNPRLRSHGDEHVERDHLFTHCDDRKLADVVRDLAGLNTPAERQHLLEARADHDRAERGEAVTPARWAVDPYAGDRRRWQPYAAVDQLVEALRREGRPSVEQRNQPDESFSKNFPLLKELWESNLRGMGGAGQQAYEKWRDVWRGESAEKYIVVNGDESEPATFKDRELLLHKPHLVLEGVILAGVLTRATRGYVYIRHEYPEQVAAVEAAIREAEQLGYCGPRAERLGGMSFPVEVFISPGGYICGEASALLEAMEDRRAEPRNKPPALEANGLYGKPTLVSNVETFAWVAAIYLNRAANVATPENPKPANWYLNPPGGRGQGRRFFSVCGDVARPGVYEVPIGITFGQLIDDYCGKVRDNLPLKAIAPSGPSGGFLPPRVNVARLKKRLSEANAKAEASGNKLRGPEARAWAALQKADGDWLDVREMELEIDFFRVFGAALGAGIAIYADRPGVDMLDQAINFLEFFRNESCGKCVPCRLGSRKLVDFAESLRRGELSGAAFADLRPAYAELMKVMRETSICGLGASAPAPLQTVLDSFDDWKRYVPAEKK